MKETTDESDDENVQMLLDALDPNLLSNNLYKVKSDTHTEPWQDKKTSETQNKINNQPKSQRYIQLDDEPTDTFNISTSMQQFFAKKLSAMVSAQIDFVNINNEIFPKKRKKPKSRIKLLKDYDIAILDYVIPDFQNYPMKKPKIKRRVIESDELTEIEKCKAVAVEPNFIYSGKETRYWSNRSKAEIFQYVKSKNESKYVYIEPKRL